MIYDRLPLRPLARNLAAWAAGRSPARGGERRYCMPGE
jgi:hypothetical protein